MLCSMPTLARNGAGSALTARLFCASSLTNSGRLTKTRVWFKNHGRRAGYRLRSPPIPECTGEISPGTTTRVGRSFCLQPALPGRSRRAGGAASERFRITPRNRRYPQSDPIGLAGGTSRRMHAGGNSLSSNAVKSTGDHFRDDSAINAAPT